MSKARGAYGVYARIGHAALPLRRTWVLWKTGTPPTYGIVAVAMWLISPPRLRNCSTVSNTVPSGAGRADRPFSIILTEWRLLHLKHLSAAFVIDGPQSAQVLFFSLS